MKKIFYSSILLMFFLTVMNAAAQTNDKKITKEQAENWFEKKDWLGGLQIKPHKSINIPELAAQYQLNKVHWDKAFAFLKEQDLQTIEIGRHPIDSDFVYAMVTNNPTKEYDSTKWESHRNYVDLQYVITGEEKIGVSPIEKLKVIKAYDSLKDIINYSGKGKIYAATPETFFLFFPSDAHRPLITTGGNKTDRKIVIKIKYGE